MPSPDDTRTLVPIAAADLTSEDLIQVFDASSNSTRKIVANTLGSGTTESVLALLATASFSNATGNTTITIPEGCKLYTVYGTFTGSAGTRIIVIDATNAVDGCEVRFLAKLPTTASIVIDVRALTTGGTQLDTITTDTSGDDALFIFGYTTEWNKLVTQYPN